MQLFVWHRERQPPQPLTTKRQLADSPSQPPYMYLRAGYTGSLSIYLLSCLSTLLPHSFIACDPFIFELHHTLYELYIVRM